MSEEVALTLSPAEHKLLLYMLHGYEVELGSRICNDFDLKDCRDGKGKRLFSPEERAALAATYTAYQRTMDPTAQPADPKQPFFDFDLVAMLRTKLTPR